MQFLLLVYEDMRRWAKLNDAETAAEIKEYRAFRSGHGEAVKGGSALAPVSEAKTVRVRNGQRSTTDGPFAESKEQLGGYFLVEANSVDEAAAMAAKLPGARYGGVEVRPIMVFPQAASLSA